MNPTPRQLEVLRLLRDGRTIKATADQLKVSMGTIYEHIDKMHKLAGVNNRVSLIMWALRRKLIDL